MPDVFDVFMTKAYLDSNTLLGGSNIFPQNDNSVFPSQVRKKSINNIDNIGHETTYMTLDSIQKL